MNFPWFKRIGIFFIPATVIGWILFAGEIVFAVYIFRDVDSKSHSVSDSLINFVFYLLISGAVYSLVAYLTSMKHKSA
jgi:uncharacterized membrane protein